MSFQLTTLYNQPEDAARSTGTTTSAHPLAVKLPGLQRFAVSRPGPTRRQPAAYYLVAEWPTRVRARRPRAGALATCKRGRADHR